MKSLLTIIGTRAEAIKLMPVLKVLNKRKSFISKICLTQQHYQINELLETYGLTSDFTLPFLETKGSLHLSASHILAHLGGVLNDLRPDLVIVQGDTTTAFIGALAAFYARIPVAHVEAGLRTKNLNSPWPEEAHRILIDKIATYFFAPTLKARDVLLEEGVSCESIWVVGNTAIDALRQTINMSDVTTKSSQAHILVTVHRREAHGESIKEICKALYAVGLKFPDVQISFILHPNPEIQAIIRKSLSKVPNILITEPLSHSEFIKLMQNASYIVTDSGGVQEEASFLGKPVIIVRDTTEREEALEQGTAILAGTRSEGIIEYCSELIENPSKLEAMSRIYHSYGDGYAAERIVEILDHKINKGTDCAL